MGENETDNVRIDGQIINRGANRIQISGQHITIDSTKYGGPEIAHVPFSESIIAFEIMFTQEMKIRKAFLSVMD